MKTDVYTILVLFLFIFSKYSYSQTFSQPQCVVYDYINNCYLVSSSGNSQILEMDSKGKIKSFFVVNNLNHPKGMVILGDTIFVTDENYLRGFLLDTKTSILNFEIPGLFSLVDICADSSGNLFISDNNQNKIIKYNISGSVYEFLNLKGTVNTPKGIIYEKDKNRLIVVSSEKNGIIQAIDLSTLNVTTIKETVYNYLEGITKDFYGNYYISTLEELSVTSKGKIIKYDKGFVTPPVIIDSNLARPADILFNVMNDTLYIPLLLNDSVKVISQVVPPQKPEIIFPPDGAVLDTNKISVILKKIRGATLYNIKIYRKATGDVLYVEYNNDPKPYSLTDSEIFMPLFYNWQSCQKSYIVSVAAGNTAGWCKEYDSHTFTLGVRTIPILLKPPDSSTSLYLNPLLEWNGVQGNSYTIEIDTSINFDSPVKIYIKTSNLYYNVEEMLHYGTTYYWRVKLDCDENDNIWSQIWRFTTLGLSSNNEITNLSNNILQIFPNPIHDFAKIIIANTVNITTELNIFNIYSEKVNSFYTDLFSDNHNIIDWDTSNLPQGVYYIELKMKGFVLYQKAIILR
jgi:hypothetical protein